MNPEEQQKLLTKIGIAALLFYLLKDRIYEYFLLYPKISYTNLIESIERGEVKHIRILNFSDKESNQFIVALIDFQNGKVMLIDILDLTTFLENIKVAQQGHTFDRDSLGAEERLFSIYYNYKNYMLDDLCTISNIAYFMVIFIVVMYFVKHLKKSAGDNNIGNFTSMNMMGNNFEAKKFSLEKNIKVKFSDVAGLKQTKLETMEFVEFLKNPKKFERLGARIPKGALFSGPAGTGKTMLAKACAGEADVSFFYTSGSEFVEMFVGLGASRIRSLFKEAKKEAPSIIFIDEIDAIGKKRDGGLDSGNDERNNTLNQLLVELDGFESDTNVVVFAATNRKNLLDEALTRTGRFDRSIEFLQPDLSERKEIFEVHLEPLTLSKEQTQEDYAKRMATLTPGLNGSDIANICNEAAILAARGNQEFVTPDNFETAVERVFGGLELKKSISKEETKVIAFHESGHAIMGWFLEGGDPLLKLSIIPRTKGFLGFSQFLPNETSLEREDHILDKICMILGGRVAEEEFFGRITTGAYDDLNRAYSMARSYVAELGMSKKLGNINFNEKEFNMKMYSDYTNEIVDEEVEKIIVECTKRTRDMIKEKRSLIEKLSEVLLEKKTINLNDIVSVLGDRPFEPKSTYKAYLEQMNKDSAK